MIPSIITINNIMKTKNTRRTSFTCPCECHVHFDDLTSRAFESFRRHGKNVHGENFHLQLLSSHEGRKLMRDKQLIICTGCNNPYVLGGFHRHGCVKKNKEKGVVYLDYSGHRFLYRWDEGLGEFVSIGVQRTATSSSSVQQPT